MFMPSPTAHAIRLSPVWISKARKYGKISKRTIPKQIEYWAEIGQILEENPDMSYSFLKNTLIGMQEIQEGETSEYIFG